MSASRRWRMSNGRSNSHLRWLNSSSNALYGLRTWHSSASTIFASQEESWPWIVQLLGKRGGREWQTRSSTCRGMLTSGNAKPGEEREEGKDWATGTDTTLRHRHGFELFNYCSYDLTLLAQLDIQITTLFRNILLRIKFYPQNERPTFVPIWARSVPKANWVTVLGNAGHWFSFRPCRLCLEV